MDIPVIDKRYDWTVGRSRIIYCTELDYKFYQATLLSINETSWKIKEFYSMFIIFCKVF